MRLSAGAFLAAALLSALAFTSVSAHAVCTEAEIEPYLQQGTAGVEGTVAGLTIPAKGVPPRGRVELFPRTPCFEAWWDDKASHAFVNDAPAANYPARDPLFQSAVRTAALDAQGRFAIYGLAPGRYRVRVPWLEQTAGAYVVTVSGKYLYAEVVLEADRNVVLKLKP